MPELVLDHPEGVFDLGADAGLDLLQLGLESPDRRRLVQNLALARLHGHRMPRVLREGVRTEDFELVPQKGLYEFTVLS